MELTYEQAYSKLEEILNKLETNNASLIFKAIWRGN